MRKITLCCLRQPAEENLERDIEWFCESFGLLGTRDKNKTGLKIFKSMIRAAKNDKEVSIDELSRSADVSRTAVMHHVKIMEGAGLVVKERGGFTLRMRSLQKVIDEIELDIERTLNSIREIAEGIDNEIGLSFRKRALYDR